MSLGFTFSEAEIDSIGQRLGIKVSDSERRAVLRQASTCDVQAGPGTGKTTLLVAKLAMLAERWTAPDTGICVLSHTNIARVEVENRLAKSSSLQRLLDYPHFIGTIQTFADQFLALPYMRFQKIEVTAVDNDRFAAVALKEFAKSDYNGLRTYLRNRNQQNGDRVKALVAGLKYSGPTMFVKSANGNLGFANTTSNSYQQVKTLKEAVSSQGVFRYDDMFTYAELALNHCKYLIELVRQRFPWVFVDEVQDTNSDQDALLRTLFGNGCVYIRLGDENQSIFGDHESEDGTASLFTAKAILPISSSLRFGAQIAGFASPLTIVRPQTLVGSPDRGEKPHTIFIFNRSSVTRVIPEFAELVLKLCDKEELKLGKVKVVGLRKAAPGTNVGDHFPFCLRDYWSGFMPDIASLSTRPRSLLGYVMEARRLASGHKLAKPAFESLMQGILGFLHRQGTLAPDGKRWSRGALYQVLQDASPDTLPTFQELLRRLCLGDSVPSESEWRDSVKVLLACFAPLNPGNATEDAKAFLSCESALTAPTAPPNGTPQQTGNVFTHTSGSRALEIEIGTIHSAKGETHSATLVVETFSSVHDIEKLLPVLTGQAQCGSLAVKAKGHCKCIFVGMTRPAHLLCLAIFRDHLRNGDVTALKDKGWNIVELND